MGIGASISAFAAAWSRTPHTKKEQTAGLLDEEQFTEQAKRSADKFTQPISDVLVGEVQRQRREYRVLKEDFFPRRIRQESFLHSEQDLSFLI